MFQLSKGQDDLLCKILRMGSRKPDPLQPRHLIYLSQQLGESQLMGVIFGVRVYILTKKDYLLRPSLDQGLYLGQDFTAGTASLPPPHRGDDTITAKVIAPLHNGDIGAQLLAVGDREMNRGTILKAHRAGPLPPLFHI